jgi:hypothetical protein
LHSILTNFGFWQREFTPKRWASIALPELGTAQPQLVSIFISLVSFYCYIDKNAWKNDFLLIDLNFYP